MVKKVLYPIAGMGTRFLPFTKEVPKEMVPVLGKPLIQYAVEEALASGIRSNVYVVSRGKEALENYFSPNIELEHFLRDKDKLELLGELEPLFELEHLFIRQLRPLGFGYAVSLAEAAVRNEAFAVILPDDLIVAGEPVTRQMISVYEKYQCSVIAFREVPFQEVRRYGIAGGPMLEERVFQIEQLVEKPDRDQAPSNYAVIGRYILTPAIFDCLREVRPGAGGEIQLTDAIRLLMKREKVLGYFFRGERFDCGTVEGYAEAFVSMALRHRDYGPRIRETFNKNAV